MKHLLWLFILLVLPATGQTINPNQISPCPTNGQVLVTEGGVTTCGAAPLNGAVLENPTGNQAVTQPTGTNLSVNTLNEDYYIQGGGDFCAKANSIIASLPNATTPYVIRVKSGTYTCSAEVTYDPLYGSIIGDGQNQVSITALNGGTTLHANEATFTITYAGQLSGFTLVGNGSANQVGIQGGNIINWLVNDVQVENFTGTGASGIYLYNHNGAWFERNAFTHIQLENNTCGINFNTDGSTGSYSFGYNDFDVWANANAGQSVWCVNNGNIYHSTIGIKGNIGPNGTVITLASPAGMYTTNFDIQMEGSSPCTTFNIDNRVGGQGLVDVYNCTAFTGTAVPEILASSLTPFGTLTNYEGSGNTASANILSAPYGDGLWQANFGSLTGANVGGWFLTLQNTTFENAFQIFECGSTAATSLSQCLAVHTFTAGGDYVNSHSITSYGVVQGGTLTDGTCSIHAGVLSGCSTGTSTVATNLSGGAAYQVPQQEAANTTSFITSPSSAGTYFLSKTLSGSSDVTSTWANVNTLPGAGISDQLITSAATYTAGACAYGDLTSPDGFTAASSVQITLASVPSAANGLAAGIQVFGVNNAGSPLYYVCNTTGASITTTSGFNFNARVTP